MLSTSSAVQPAGPVVASTSRDVCAGRQMFSVCSTSSRSKSSAVVSCSLGRFVPNPHLQHSFCPRLYSLSVRGRDDDARVFTCAAVELEATGGSNVSPSESTPLDGVAINDVPAVHEHEPLLLQDLAVRSLLASFAEMDRLDTEFQKSVVKSEELVHQFRVALRRLRNIVDVFGDTLALPKRASRRAMTRILRVIGTLRDQDVLQLSLQRAIDESKAMGPKEKLLLESVQAAMKAERELLQAQVVEEMGSKDVRKLVNSMRLWLANPQFSASVDSWHKRPAASVIPQWLSLHVAEMLLHPSWLVEEIKPPPEERKALNKSILGLDLMTAAHVHELRKEIRELRYALEFLSPLYAGGGEPDPEHGVSGDIYSRQIEMLTELQSILGKIQDLHVLATYMANVKLPKGRRLTSLTAACKLRHEELWTKWMKAREALMGLEARQMLQKAVLRPSHKALHVQQSMVNGST